jgi:ubiquinone/menaquinone biosynthesis C-methylase UbiE
MATERRSEGEQKASMESLYTDVAERFDHVGPRLFTAFGRRLVDFAGLGPGEAVLDVGCGRGAILFAAAERVGAEGRAVGIDLTPAMVEHCRADARRAGLDQVEVAAMDAERLELPDGAFDAVLGGFMIFLCPAPPRALAEAFRVLAPGGRIAVSTFPPEQDRRWWWLPALIQRLRPHQVVRQPYSTEAELAQALEEAGFRDCETAVELVDIAYESEEEWLQTLRSHGHGHFLDDLSAEELDGFRRTAWRHLSAAREDDGRIHHRMGALFGRAVKPA